MSFSGIHDLKTLILSFHPVIAIETTEEERVETLLKAVAGRLKLPLYVWTITQGLKQYPQNKGVFNTDKPQALLKTLEGFHQEGIFLLKDFSQHLDDVVLARQFREIAQRFSRDRATMVLTDAQIKLSPELAMMAVYYDLELPTQKELFDIEKGFSSSSRGSSDGGLSQRLLGALLTWLQEKRQEVFLTTPRRKRSGILAS